MTDHCLRSRNYVNVIVAGKQPAPQWLTMDQAIKHCSAGLGIWDWASNDQGGEPDVVMACCGDVPTLETLAAVDLLRQHLPELKVRVVNVVDLMKLQPPSEHPHGLTDREFDALFTKDKPIIFAFHGYPVADPPAHLPAARITRTFMCAATRRRAPPRRRSTWWCSTISTASIWSGRDRSSAAARRACRLFQAGDARQADRAQAVHPDHGDDMPQITGWRWDQTQRPGYPGRVRGAAAPVEGNGGAASSTEGDNV